MNRKISVFLNGLIKENPTFVQLLGMCPTLAVTTGLKNGLGMGLSATAVLIASNTLISLLRKVIPEKVRIAAYIVIIAAFVTIIEMCLNAFLPDLASQLGIFIPLIVVNCIILARAESFASKNTVADSAVYSCTLHYFGCTRIYRLRHDLGYSGLRRYNQACGYHYNAARRIYSAGMSHSFDKLHNFKDKKGW